MGIGPSREELLVTGKRAANKGDCDNVIVAPDHTGEDNYHNCTLSAPTRRPQPPSSGLHFCGCGYAWEDSGRVVTDPFAGRS